MRAWGVLAALVLVTACVKVETFFFSGRVAGPYQWDETDPALDGDLSAPHPSLVPAAQRDEGMLALDTGEVLHWVMARQTTANTTVLFSHGNGPHLGRFWDRAEVLWQLGYQVVLYDYPGFGLSQGTPSEAGMYAAGAAVLAMIAGRADVDPARIVLYGHSLGAAPTYELAARAMRGEAAARPFAVVSESAWCSMQAMVEDGAFLDLPRELVTDLVFDNCTNIGALETVPTMLLHGARDRTVPPRQLALLSERARGADVHLVADAAHIDVSVTGEPWAGSFPAAGVPRPSADYAAWMLSIAPAE
jgi:fermentation-respiration switch protein FrsA (DUF1100 family)